MHTLVLAAGLFSTAWATPESVHWSGRILDQTGAPTQGTQLLSLQFWDAASGGAPVGSPVTANVDVQDGYATVPMPALGDAVQSADGLWLEISVGGDALAPRQPVGAAPFSVVTSRIGAMSGALPSGCSETGAIRWHTDTDTLQICNGTWWYEFRADAVLGHPIVTDAGVREWADGSVADNCDGYRNPPVGYQWGGDNTSGLYSVQPAGEPAPITVYCDMSGSLGWTLVSRVIGTSQAHKGTGAVGTLTDPNQAAVAKLSDDTINRLRGDFSTSAIRFECGSGVTHFQENKVFNANGSALLSLLRCSNAFPSATWQVSGGNGGHRGLNTNSTSCEYTIYVYDGEQALGCWQGGSDEKSGRMWVY